MASLGSPQSDRDLVSGSPMLSPRSKLQAMLAAASDDDDDDDILRPRGRFASRMFDSTQETGNGAESARERVRRALNLTGSPKSDAKESAIDGPGLELSGDDDDDLQVAPRRLKRRVERRATPEGSPKSSTAKSSPGLFVSPRPQSDKADSDNGSDSDLDADISRLERSKRFQALVEEKRQKRLAREAEEEARKAAERETVAEKDLDPFLVDSDDDNVSNITDDEGGHRLTQEARPTRKASKKALEEMNRETQRMARNMQLAHQAKTRKKITKNTLFERFNFRPAGGFPEPTQTSSSRPTTPTTDAEMKDVVTPDSSPPFVEKTETNAPISLEISDNEDLPGLEQVMTAKFKSRNAKGVEADIQDKGKGKALAEDDVESIPKPVEPPKRRVRVKLPPMTVNTVTLDLDDELTVTGTKKSKLDAIFDQVPHKQNTESRSLQALRSLAHVTSPGKGPRARKDKKGISAGEFQAMLAARVREQAKLEKEKRLEVLRAKGVVIQTEEERARQIEEVENLVARAREEADEIMQKEKAEAKKERREKQKNGEVDAIGWDDSSDDDDYDGDNDGDNDEEQELDELDLSGSEDEGDEEGDEDAEEDDLANPLFENEAEDGESEASDKEDLADLEDKAMDIDDEDNEEGNVPSKFKSRRPKRSAIILSDDEDDVRSTPGPKPTYPRSPAVPNADSPVVPRSVLRSATKNFIPGFPVAGGAPAGLGLTQMFAGTLAGTEDQRSPDGTMMSPLQSLDPFSRPSFMQDDDDDGAVDEDVVMDSQAVPQTQVESLGMDLHFTQAEMHQLDSLVRDDVENQEHELFELTQDQGLENHTPLKERFIEAPPSALSTVPQTATHATQATQPISHDSPLVRKGRLRRRLEVINEDKSGSEAEESKTDEFGFGTSAFGVMKEAARKEKRRLAKEEFDRKKSKAKEMVEEQAAESEDEYAGLGGADGEDSDDEWDKASVKDMIDDEKNQNEAEDERKLAALYAERARAEDEKNVEKLFKDITTGMLRRKRGADYDLDDSDDDGEARRRLKRRQFAKQQKALFADERVKKMAENPGNQAFLRTLEDHVSDDEMDIINVGDPDETEDSQSQSQSDTAQAVVPDSQPTSEKRPQAPLKSAGGNLPPASMRRTKDGKKPSNLIEIRESLSSLLEDPDTAVIPATQYESESGGEEDAIPSTSRSDKENRAPENSRRTSDVRDRISLKRANSSSSSVNARHAFTIGSTQSAGSFKAPALLRRATSNSFMSSVSASSSGTSTPTGNGKNAFGDKIKKGASKGSGVIREKDRAGAKQIAGMREKRNERRMRGAEDRLKAVTTGVFGGAEFE